MVKRTDHQYIWMDGEIRSWAESTTHVMSHGLHYGSGCFEGIRCYATDSGPSIFRLTDHINRLERSAHMLQMELPYSVDQIMQACVQLVEINRLESTYIRPIAFYGSESLGVHPGHNPIHVAIACLGWGAYLGEEGLEKGVRIGVSSWQKFSSSAMPANAKTTGQYLNSMLATVETRQRGFDEALLLNADGTISEGSGQNIFLVKDGVLYTNDEQASILMGITRNTIIQVAVDLGIPVDIGVLTMEQLYAGNEVFFTGTASEVTPIREVEGRPVGNGAPGEMTRQLQALYQQIVHGRQDEYRHWLTSVREVGQLRLVA